MNKITLDQNAQAALNEAVFDMKTAADRVISLGGYANVQYNLPQPKQEPK